MSPPVRRRSTIMVVNSVRPAAAAASTKEGGRQEVLPPHRPPGLGGGDDAETTGYLPLACRCPGPRYARPAGSSANNGGRARGPSPWECALPAGATEADNATHFGRWRGRVLRPVPQEFVPLAGATVANGTPHLVRARSPTGPSPFSSGACSCRRTGVHLAGTCAAHASPSGSATKCACPCSDFTRNKTVRLPPALAS